MDLGCQNEAETWCRCEQLCTCAQHAACAEHASGYMQNPKVVFSYYFIVAFSQRPYVFWFTTYVLFENPYVSCLRLCVCARKVPREILMETQEDTWPPGEPNGIMNCMCPWGHLTLPGDPSGSPGVAQQWWTRGVAHGGFYLLGSR